MKRSVSAVSFVVLSLAALTFVRAADPAPSENHVIASLISSESNIRPGRPFQIGVLLEIDPGWHVYWTNPGEGGLPTVVKFTAPEGFVVTPDPFPIPHAFRQGKETTYGYDRAVLLTAHVTPPMDIRTGTAFSFQASASWLGCKETCAPGKASLEMTMKVESRTGPKNVDDFIRYGSTVAPSTARPADVASVTSKIDSATHVETLTIHWKNPATSIQLYPGCDDAVTVSNISVKKTENDATDITLKIEVAADQKPESNRLPVLIAWRDSSGHTVGWETNVPIK